MWINIIIQTTTAERIDITTIVAKSTEAVPSSRCRKNLCDTVFSIRLGGLQDGLNFRLRQLLWCEAEFELDDGNISQRDDCHCRFQFC